MPLEELTYRELVMEKLDTLDEKADRIEAQTTKTNGRVTALERDVTANEVRARVFRARITTAIAIITFIVGSVLIPLAVAFINRGHI